MVEDGDVGSRRERRVDVVSVCGLESGLRRLRLGEGKAFEDDVDVGAFSPRRSSSDSEVEEYFPSSCWFSS